MRIKRILGVSILMLSIVLVGCGNNLGISTELINLSVDKEVSNDGNYSIKVEIKKGAKNVSYSLSENGSEIDSKEGINGPFEKESNIRNSAKGEYTYTLKVMDENEGVVSKEIVVKVEEAETTDEENENNVQLKEEPWDKNSKEYVKGDKVSYENAEYECVQPHTSQQGWSPKNTPALWSEIKE